MVAALICVLIIACMLSALTAGEAAADDNNNATATPDYNITIPPLPIGTPTPTPPAERQVFFDARWDTDHVSVQVNNNGPAITVEACIGSLANKTTAQVGAGASVKVLTQAIDAKDGDIIRYWFKAYENGTLIDSMDGNVQVEARPTIAPETAIVTGTVRDASSNAAIAGAEVTFVPRDFDRNYPEATTDSAGTFTTSGKMSPGVYYLTVRAYGYEPKTLTIDVGNGAQQLSEPITLVRSAGPSPTPGPSATPTPTPGSPIDAWMNLLYNPTVCVSTIAIALGGAVSATAIYEWTLKQRERRKKDGEQK
ncbi:MAG: hypothetical protein A4E28_00183 [Methanocella sp. PtaU1.Bin125]|nr:MAG: hypothetical protein A4E28_00183 [Methanocella sp. PtaU1.Bin125]